MRALLAALAVWALVALLPMSAAQACSCVGFDFDEAVEAADLIAEIRVEKQVGETSDGYLVYSLLVNRVWKGDPPRRIIFATQEETTACGLGRLRAGDVFVTWAHQPLMPSDAPGPLPYDYVANWCELPMEGGGADELTSKLGEPTDRTGEAVPPLDDPVAIDPDEGAEPEPEDGPNLLVVAAGIGLVTAAGAVVLIVVTGVAVLVHERRKRN